MPQSSIKLAGVLVFIGSLSVCPIALSSSLIKQPGNLIRLGDINVGDPGTVDLLEQFSTPSGPETPETPETVQQSLRLEIRLSKRQVTLYRGDTVVKRYPIAVGKPGWETPTGTFKVRQKIKNPTWVHPLEKGVVIPAGDPENPLGRYWIGFWTDGKNWIGFHGTPNPRSIGRPASHGCVRMYNKDIEELFKQVELGAVVTVVK